MHRTSSRTALAALAPSGLAQALAYKTGLLEIHRLRDEARRRLGERFDLRGFHHVVLGSGAVTLPTLRQQVESWISTREAAR